MDLTGAQVIKQHLIDPEICIRCNTCESTCPTGAITHDARNYVVNAATCNNCLDCIAPCPTGSIDNWRMRAKASAYTIEEQLGWDVLPAEVPLPRAGVAAGGAAPGEGRTLVDRVAVLEGLPLAERVPRPGGDSAERVAPVGRLLPEPAATSRNEQAAAVTESAAVHIAAKFSATQPPWSAAVANTLLYGPKAKQPFIEARVSGNFRVTEIGREYDTHHIVLDFGAAEFPLLEGQSIGIVPPGVDANGRPHHARQYSIASPRDGERPGYNNVSLTVKRVLVDYQGQPVRGVASNYLCDLAVGERMQVIGPFGRSFLMPNHVPSNIVMICTGTGSAPMRAMTERRRRLLAAGQTDGGKLMLFFGARTQQELPYFGPLQSLPKDFIDINFAYSRTPGQPKRHVQDLMRERAADLATLLRDEDTCIYVCGLKSMEQGVVLALQDVAEQSGLSWATLSAALKNEGRLHLETY